MTHDLTRNRKIPVPLVEHDRRGFPHPNFNTRVTMDNRLRCCDFCYDLFSRRLNFRAAMPPEADSDAEADG